jgi:eukaryotic-like serine/threonine-protein kinase
MVPPALIAGRFELGEPVAQGGMGRLFRAHDRLAGCAVALKLMQPGNSVRRFLREAAALARLREHPNVVRYVAHGVDPEHGHFLAMEWLEGEDLAQRLTRGPLSVPEAWWVAREASEALARAHDEGLVHRDLKPSNLFIERTPTGQRLRLLDFGVVREPGQMPPSQTGHAVGTPSYMAPEQVRGEPDVGPAADVFALGCVLWECVVGTPPFQAANAAGALAKILFDPTPSLAKARPGSSPALDALLSRMLARSAEQRISDGRALCAALAGPAPSDGSAAAPAKATPFGVRERRVLSLLVVGSGLVDDGRTPVFGERTPGVQAASLRSAAKAHGGAIDELADGTAIVTFDLGLPAAEQARVAARCAVAVRQLCRPRPVCVVSGRTDPEDASPIGTTVDRAASLLRAGAPHEDGVAYVDELSASLIDAEFACEGSGERRVLIGPRVLHERGGSALVGRRFELASLMLAWEDACRGHPRAVLLSGDAGIGKTRLTRALIDALTDGGGAHTVWVGRGDPLRVESAFDFLVRMLRAGLGVDGDPHAELPPALRDDAPLASLLGLSSPAVMLAEDGRARLRAVAEAVARCLARAASVQPLLVVLEDAHWADGSSLRVLDMAAELLGGARVVLLALTRPELGQRLPHFFDAPSTLRVGLARLDLAESVELARASAGGRLGEAALARAAALGEGNPFFVEELVSSLRQGMTELPASVLAVVDARLACLDRDERALLAAASLFGTSFSLGALRAVLEAEGEPGVPEGVLARLLHAQLIVERDASYAADARTFSFRHALLCEGARARLCVSDMRRGHLAAARWLVAAGERDPAVLAHHFAHGGESAEAARYTVLAVRKARQAWDHELVVKLSEEALAAGLPPDEAARVHEELCNVYGVQGDYGRSLQHMFACRQLSPAEHYFDLVAQMIPAVAMPVVPNVAPVLAAFDRVLGTVPEPDGEAMWCAVFTWALWELWSMGFHREVLARTGPMESALARVAEGYGGAPHWHIARIGGTSVSAEYDPYAAFCSTGRTALALEGVGEIVGASIAHCARTMCAIELGAHEQARAAAARVREGALTASVLYRFHAAHATALVALGALDDAEALIVRVRATVGRAPVTDQGRIDAVEARLAWARHDQERADQLWTAAAQKLGRVRPERCEVVLRHARACSARGAADRAGALLADAASTMVWLSQQGYAGPLPMQHALTQAEHALAVGHGAARSAYLAEAGAYRQAVAARIDDPALRAGYLASAD